MTVLDFHSRGIGVAVVVFQVEVRFPNTPLRAVALDWACLSRLVAHALVTYTYFPPPTIIT